MIKILTILGTRPQFIKAALVSQAIARTSGIEEIVVHTDQHSDMNMSGIFFQELEIPNPRYHLNISGGAHGDMIGRMLVAIEEVINKEQPDRILVYGDSNSTLAGALSAARLHTPITHVEAGLRSFNLQMPEEINRVVTDHLSDQLLTPTASATANLLHENIPREWIHQVGDVMYDAALFYRSKAEKCSQVLKNYGLAQGKYVLVTVHRQENTSSSRRMELIVEALRRVAQDMPVVWPLHPRTSRCLPQGDVRVMSNKFILLPPLGYLDMVMLERNAAVIATDSGGIQKESYFHRVPCVTLRYETEWIELVEMGWNRLAPPGKADIAESILQALNTTGIDSMPYGSGDATEQILAHLQGRN
jgi:UDP-GlcNAc3NAcA epimerase